MRRPTTAADHVLISIYLLRTEESETIENNCRISDHKSCCYAGQHSLLENLMNFLEKCAWVWKIINQDLGANCNCSYFRSDVSISLYTKKTKVEHLCNTYHHSTQVGGSGLQFQPVIICHKSSQNCVFLSTYSKTFKHRMKFLAGKKSVPESIHASLFK